MSRIIQENIHSHDKTVFTNELPVTPSAFLERLEEKLAGDEIPGAKISRVTHREGLSSREYLRVERGVWHFDVGASTFGKGMFFSWWLARKPFRAAGAIAAGLWFILLLIVFGSLLSGGLNLGRTLSSLLGWTIGLFVLVIVAGTTVPPHVEEKLQEIPFFGGLFSLVASSAPYHQIDTAEIFAAQVKAIVEETIEEVTSGQGVSEAGVAEPSNVA